MSTPRVTFASTLHNREFRTLWAADAQSGIGDQLARIALASIVFTRTGSPLLTAVAYAATFLPALAGPVLLGALADRVPRKQVLVAVNLSRAALIGAVSIPALPLWSALSLVAVATVLEAPFNSANSALLADVFAAEVDTYAAASALKLITHQSAQVLGFACGGLVLTVVSPLAALRLDAVSFLVAAALVQPLIRSRPAPAGEHGIDEGYWRSVCAGVSVVARRADLRTLALLAWVVGFYVVPEGLAIPYAAHLHAGNVAAGILLAANPAGQVVGVAAYKRGFTPQWCRTLIGPLAVAAGAPLVACALGPDVAVSSVLWAGSGACCAYMAQLMPEFVTRTPPARRGQAIGVAAAGLTAAQGVGILLAGLVATSLATPAVVALAGLAGMVCAAPLALGWRAHRHGPDTELSMSG